MENPEVPTPAPAPDVTLVVNTPGAAEVAQAVTRGSRTLVLALLLALSVGLAFAALYFSRSSERLTHDEAH